jgi:hypothetical protein
MKLTEKQRTAMFCALNAGIESYERSAREQPENAEFWRERIAAGRDALEAFELHFYGPAKAVPPSNPSTPNQE